MSVWCSTRGAAIAVDFPSLEGEGPEARTLKLNDSADLAAKRDELQSIIRAWCDQRD